MKVMNNNPNSNSDDEIETSITKERLCQARYSFNATYTATAVYECISLVGGALLLSAKVTEGTVTAASGMATSLGCINFAKRYKRQAGQASYSRTSDGREY